MSKVSRALIKGLKEVTPKKFFFEDIKMAIYISDYMNWFFNGYFAVHRFFSHVKKVIEFIPHVWRFQDWDSAYVMEFNVYLYERLYKGCYVNGNHVFKQKEADQLKLVIALCKRIAKRDDYTDSHYDYHMKRWGKDKESFRDSLETKEENGRKVTYWIDPVERRTTPGEYKQYQNEVAALHKHEEYLYKQDVELLNKLLKKHSRKWWD